jgi:hypothetical protein
MQTAQCAVGKDSISRASFWAALAARLSAAGAAMQAGQAETCGRIAT